MADYNSTVPQNQEEQQVKNLKRFLEGWRMAVLPLKSVILWEQQWHPCAIIGSVSFIYFLIWIMNLNSLATFAVIGLFVNFVDFIVPVICNSLYGPTSWTGQHEKMFEEVCKSIVTKYNRSLQSVSVFYSWRETTPYMYYLLSISLLVTLAWVASSINNTFLLYILSTVMLLWPGVQHRGIFNTLLSMYYLLSISLLVTLTWVASSINNTFLLYILSTVKLLWPGVQHRGIFNTLLSMYYLLSISLLVTLTWVASSINNTFLLYILSTVKLLWPGVQHRGIFNTLLSMVNFKPKSYLKTE